MPAETTLLVATDRDVVTLDLRGTEIARSPLPGGTTSLAATADGDVATAWCGVGDGGLLRSEDRGRNWRTSGLDGERVTALAVSPTARGRLWAGTEPSALWCSEDRGESWQRRDRLTRLPSSAEWSFPPRPETHHVRWIACHPGDPERLWLAIEAGALVSTLDGGRSWRDRTAGGPRDSHEIAIHPQHPDRLRIAAGDGYFESDDGGESWRSPAAGLETRYLRSVAIDPGDPEVILLSGASGPRSAYVAGRSDGRLYRREGSSPWTRVLAGWPESPSTIAPLLIAGHQAGELWAADERGVHRSADGGRSWERAALLEPRPSWLRGLALF